jgi:hypothetical protein
MVSALSPRPSRKTASELPVRARSVNTSTCTINNWTVESFRVEAAIAEILPGLIFVGQGELAARSDAIIPAEAIPPELTRRKPLDILSLLMQWGLNAPGIL